MNALSRNARGILTPRERITLVGNTAALLDAGAISGEEYLSTLLQLAEDPLALDSAAGLCRLNLVLGEFFADAAGRLSDEAGVSFDSQPKSPA